MPVHAITADTDAKLPLDFGAGLRLDDLPQLRALTWHLPGDMVVLTPQEAFEIYERNWRHVDQEALSVHEAAVIDQLIRTIGNGVLLV